MVAAWNHLEGGDPKPNELILLDYIDRYGAQAVVGRTLGAGELRSMTVAGNVRQAYVSRMNYRDKDGAENWTEWARNNPEMSQLLNHAAMLADKQNGE
jgi:hypothetical protein